MASTMDYVGPAIGALVFVLGMSLVAEPQRKTINAFLVAGASGVYISGGFGVVEVLVAAVLLIVAYRGLSSYSWIGAAWLLHAAWDVPHHLWHRPIWPFQATSSLGCVIFDSLIALWFFANSPVFIASRHFLDETDRSR
jgi:hypothetical protein